MARGSKRGRQTGDSPDGKRTTGGWGSLVSRAGKGAGRLRDAAHELRRSPIVQHAFAARERGNLEAAFWLLAEECRRQPDDARVNLAYWDVAVALQRVDLAASAGVELIHQHAASGEIELAAQYWLELIRAAPEVFVSPTAIASILPELRRLLDAAPDGERMELQGFLRRAMRHAVDPRNKGLHPGVALRLFEDGRDLNPEAARRAAEVALDSPNLHEAKRTRLRAWLDGSETDSPGAPPTGRPTGASRAGQVNATPSSSAESTAAGSSPKANGLSEAEIATAAARLPLPRAEPDAALAPGSSPAELPEPIVSPASDGGDSRTTLDPPEPLPLSGKLKLIEAIPVALAADELELQTPEGVRTRVAYPDIEAVCVVEVAGLAEQPVAVIDLVLNWSRQGAEPLRVVRLRGDAFDGAELVPGPCVAGGELASFLGEVLLRSRAVPLPDPESALGLQLTTFESLERYEREILHGLLADETPGSGD